MGVLLGLQKLFRYISGYNADSVIITKTAPYVAVLLHPNSDFTSAEKNFTLSFYLPQQFQVLLLLLC